MVLAHVLPARAPALVIRRLLRVPVGHDVDVADSHRTLGIQTIKTRRGLLRIGQSGAQIFPAQAIVPIMWKRIVFARGETPEEFDGAVDRIVVDIDLADHALHGFRIPRRGTEYLARELDGVRAHAETHQRIEHPWPVQAQPDMRLGSQHTAHEPFPARAVEIKNSASHIALADR